MRKLLTFLIALATVVVAVVSPGISQTFMMLGAGSASAPAPIIDEQFTIGTYLPGPIASDLVDTRSTTKYVTNASGVLQSIAVNTLPISTAGMLVEPAATNILFPSQVLSGLVLSTAQ